MTFANIDLSAVTPLISIAAVVCFLGVNQVFDWASDVEAWKENPPSDHTDKLAKRRLLKARGGPVRSTYWVSVAAALPQLILAAILAWAGHIHGEDTFWIFLGVLLAIVAVAAIGGTGWWRMSNAQHSLNQ